ncbi:hypothetical protein F5I97DRAFT_334235 [Phlebopus sp. FC_14]|nr:hypothetical protein F5I97DRAFT_334235 [Phlebopus sp. FC_14]
MTFHRNKHSCCTGEGPRLINRAPSLGLFGWGGHVQCVYTPWVITARLTRDRQVWISPPSVCCLRNLQSHRPARGLLPEVLDVLIEAIGGCLGEAVSDELRGTFRPNSRGFGNNSGAVVSTHSESAHRPPTRRGDSPTKCDTTYHYRFGVRRNIFSVYVGILRASQSCSLRRGALRVAMNIAECVRMYFGDLRMMIMKPRPRGGSAANASWRSGIRVVACDDRHKSPAPSRVSVRQGPLVGLAHRRDRRKARDNKCREIRMSNYEWCGCCGFFILARGICGFSSFAVSVHACTFTAANDLTFLQWARSILLNLLLRKNCLPFPVVWLASALLGVGPISPCAGILLSFSQSCERRIPRPYLHRCSFNDNFDASTPPFTPLQCNRK